MIRLAESDKTSPGAVLYPISQRIKYMALAVDNLHLCSEYKNGSEQLKQTWADNLDIARIQQKLYAALKHQQPATIAGGATKTADPRLKQEDLRQLRFERLPVSVLYNDYAKPHKEWEICLAILHDCNHNQPDEIRNIWEKMVVRNCVAGCSVTCIPDLGRRYYSNEKSFVFPLPFLCQRLEKVAVRHWSDGRAAQERWVLEMMRQIPVSFLELQEVYSNLRSNEDLQKMRRLVVLAALYEMWHEHIVSAKATEAEKYELREQVDQVKNKIMTVMSELQHNLPTAGSGHIRDSMNLAIGKLRQVQYKFDTFANDVDPHALRRQYQYGAMA